MAINDVNGHRMATRTVSTNNVSLVYLLAGDRPLALS